jgi:hypothetical protein
LYIKCSYWPILLLKAIPVINYHHLLGDSIMLIEKSEVDLACFIKTRISALISDIPSDRGSKWIIAEHVEQTADHQGIIYYSELMIRVRIRIYYINSEREDEISWFFVKLNKRISSFIVNWNKISKNILLLGLITTNFYYKIFKSLTVRRNCVTTI